MDETSTPELPPGLANRFQPIRLLARGRHGSVILVRDQIKNRAGVLHFFETPMAEESHRNHFESHARAAQELSHPNLLPTLDHGFTPDNQPFILEEHVGSEDLTTRLQRLPPAVESERLTWSSQITRALAAIHDAGLVHGHVNPSCVRIREDGASLLGGLGLGFLGAVRPEYAYWPPERWARQHPTAKSDQWAWAAVVLALCRSRRAYTSSDPQVLQGMDLRNFRVAGFENPSAMPPGLDQTLALALAPDPGSRLESMEPLANAMDQERARAPRPPAPTDVPTKRTSVRGRTTSRIVLPKTVRAQKRNRKVFAAIALFALVSSLALLWVLMNQPAPSP